MGALVRFQEALSSSLARTFARQRKGDLVWKAEQAYALAAIAKNPALQRCTPESVQMAMLDCAWSGLSLNPMLGLAYLVPYENIATFKPGYKGLEQLVYRAGTVRVIQSVLVYDGDYFRVETVNNRRVVSHTEKHGPKAKVTAAYCILHFASTDIPYVEVMTRDQLDDVQQIATTQFGGKGGVVWKGAWQGEMQRKTVLRRALKHAPLDDGGRMEHAIAVANKFDPVDFDKAPAPREEVEQLVSRDQVTAAHAMLTDAGMPSATADRWLQLLAEAMGVEDFAKLPDSRYEEAKQRLADRLAKARAARGASQ